MTPQYMFNMIQLMVPFKSFNSKLAKVAEWFDSKKLTLNVNKTQMLIMSINKIMNPQGDVILRNEAIQRVSKSKFLGVIVDQLLNWKGHGNINCITQNF